MLLEELKVEMDRRNVPPTKMNRAQMIITIREDCLRRQQASTSAMGASPSTSAASNAGPTPGTVEEYEYWNRIEAQYQGTAERVGLPPWKGGQPVPPKAMQPPPPGNPPPGYPGSIAKAAGRLINIITPNLGDRTMNRVTAEDYERDIPVPDEDYEMPDLRNVRTRTPRNNAEEA